MWNINDIGNVSKLPVYEKMISSHIIDSPVVGHIFQQPNVPVRHSLVLFRRKGNYRAFHSCEAEMCILNEPVIIPDNRQERCPVLLSPNTSSELFPIERR